MSNFQEPYRCAIVGLGPRGLFALEQILATFSMIDHVPLQVDIFESSDYPGCGPNYAPDQPNSNQLNMPLRDVPMQTRKAIKGCIRITPFESFYDWYQERYPTDDIEIDHFPPRACIGAYLQARFEALLTEPSVIKRVTLHRVAVVALTPQPSGWKVETSCTANDIECDEVLLSIGHQPTEIDSSMKAWKNAVGRSDDRVLYTEPYPSTPLVNDSRLSAKSCIALRGMGLSMIDVVKSLTVARGGKFVTEDKERMSLRYLKAGKEPLRMVPFSLDGQPMAPKPVNKAVDMRFKPSDHLISAAQRTFTFDSQLPVQTDDLRNLLIDVVCDSTLDVFRCFLAIEHQAASPEYLPESAEEIRQACRQWLLDESFEHPLIVDTTQPTAVVMQRFLDMALGYCPPSLDYCIGQVWKHHQPGFYKQLSFVNFDSDVIESAMSLDQRLKRYAFGPPVEAIARLLALCDAELLQFRVADDPDITLTDDGWAFSQGESAVNAHCLINTVLSPANANAMNSELVSSLKRQDLLPLVHESLGVRAKDNSIISGSKPGLCATGRLIIGSVFEADALICCFGDDMPRWATDVAKRAVEIRSLPV